MHLFFIPPWIHYLLAAVVAGAAIWKGDRAARTIAGLHLILYMYGWHICQPWPHSLLCPWSRLGYRQLFEDGVTLAVCLAFALRSDRYWTIWAASIAVLPVVTDLTALALGTGVSGWAYWTAEIIWDYALDLVLLSGIFWRARERWRPATA